MESARLYRLPGRGGFGSRVRLRERGRCRLADECGGRWLVEKFDRDIRSEAAASDWRDCRSSMR